MSNQQQQQTSQRRPTGALATAAVAAACFVATAGTARGQQAGDAAAGERFVADGATVAAAGTLSLEPRASVAGTDVKLYDLCRWSAADAGAFAPLAELTVDHLGDGGSRRSSCRSISPAGRPCGTPA